MTGEVWRLALLELSDSFRLAMAELARELGAGITVWSQTDDSSPPADVSAVLILAGGAEARALDVLADLQAGGPPVYLIGASADHRVAAAAIRRGARDYFALPEDMDVLRRSLEREAREAKGKVDAERFAETERTTSGFEAMVGRSPALQRTIDQAARVAPHRDVTVLIGGETGTGKELLARAIHYAGPRADQPFVEINCAAIPATLLESELFGHEKGAFTGAIAAKPGLFELAHGGTLFLDEIGALPLELQPKLLRVLESRTVRRIGGNASRRMDVRVIGATHVDLGSASRRGEFREDLYFRLNVVTLTLPPLREREGDVELLAETFIQRIATAYTLPVPALTPELRAVLRAYPWPGNIRELRNAVERALVLSPRGALRAEELVPPPETARDVRGTLPFPVPLDMLVRSAARAMLELTSGNKSEAARRLGISRPRLQRILDGNSD